MELRQRQRQLRHSHPNKLMELEQAVTWVRSGDTVTTGGFIGTGFAEALACALEQRFLTTGQPTGLTLLYAAGQGDGADRGLNHLAHQGLVDCVIGGHWGLVPKLQRLAAANLIEAYNLPQGVISQLFRDTAAGRPGLITDTGLGSFVDPLHGGPGLNPRSQRQLVQRLELNGGTYLFYPAIRPTLALLRGTRADSAGNITMEHEPLLLEALQIAMATHNSGGLVIVQVESFLASGRLPAREVKIPGILVDAVVVAEPEHHRQTFAVDFDPALCALTRQLPQQRSLMRFDERQVIARRAFLELQAGMVVNLGIGMPEGVAMVAAEAGVEDSFTLTTEPGAIGGVPQSDLNFGASVNLEALVDQPSQFDFYDGGGLDLAVLGMAQLDQHGQVNVSQFGPRITGAGGFINISSKAAMVLFVGTFSADGLQVASGDGRLTILSEGQLMKLVPQVEQRTYAPRPHSQQRVLYITERAVFEQVAGGLRLIEIAPGVELERDVLALMGFVPLMDQPIELMPAWCFGGSAQQPQRDA